MQRSYKILGLAVCMFTIACSNQWREVDGGVSAADVKQYLADAQQVSASSTDGNGTSGLDNSNTTIFFADAPSAYGPVASVLAFESLDFLGVSGLSYKNVTQVRVFFLRGSADSGSQDTLIVGIVSSQLGSNGQLRALESSDPFSAAGVDITGTDTSGNLTTDTSGISGQTTTGTTPTNSTATASSASFTYYTFTGQGSVNDGEYSVTLTGGQRSITLRSNDVDGNTLRSVIQMRAYLADDQGNQQYLGKFSTLEGF